METQRKTSIIHLAPTASHPQGAIFMYIETLSPAIEAFIRPDEGANIGLVRTNVGCVIIDTPTFPSEMRNLLDAVAIAASDVKLVINTHYHADHTWSNQVFDCPIIAHRLCRETMEAKLKSDWSPAGIEKMIEEYEKEDPAAAAKMRSNLNDLVIRLPTEAIVEHKALLWGDVLLELIPMGGHTPGSTIVWFPNERILFASDLLFIGRYPYIDEADIPALIEILTNLPKLDARMIVPGHGPLCNNDEVIELRNYLKETWEWTKAQLQEGRSSLEIASDTTSPQYVDKDKPPGRRSQNIRVMINQISKNPSF
jgi:cyclase